MAALSKTLRQSGNRLIFGCPGCGDAHAVDVGDGAGQRWTWNHDPELPTIWPSLLLIRGEERCHLTVEAGQIHYHPDTTHALAKQTVAIPQWETT